VHTGPTQFLMSSGDKVGRAVVNSSSRGRLSALQLATPVLIIEDEMMIAWMVQSVLEDLGFSDLVIASSGEQAKADADRAKPGLIISDINLGAGCDGVEASSAISGGIVPVLFISAYADPDVRRRISRDLPAAQLLGKPVGVSELEAAIEVLLRPARDG